MTGDTPPDGLTPGQLENIQGDIWSRGFIKDYETYYFFSIEPTKGKEFSECLKDVVPLISTLKTVKGVRMEIAETKRKAVELAEKVGTLGEKISVPRTLTSNALIAFTYKGLEVINQGLGGRDKLDLRDVRNTDRAFYRGMDSDTIRKVLNDPKVNDTWDSLFRSTIIHGLLKVAGNSKTEVDAHLTKIQTVLQHGIVIQDVPGKSPPTTVDSRVDGWTRSGDHRGKEHFGFQDGISQPLMKGIDVLEPDPDNSANAVVNMNTDPHLLIVTKDTYDPTTKRTRPSWMYDGSFLVFRKLEQNVEGFKKLTSDWFKYGCKSPEYMGAKLMGRFQDGTPIARRKDGGSHQKPTNNFGFGNKDQSCPVSAHIRKTNLRIVLSSGNDPDSGLHRTRIIRSGIAYGTDYTGPADDDSKRGLLFACYQGRIEDGFENMQANWSNKIHFRTQDAGHDPIIGQVDQVDEDGKKVNGKLITNFTDETHENGRSVEFQQLVTLRGGGYFFVPSIQALKHGLVPSP